MTTASSQRDLVPGEDWAGYQVLGLLGQGGMSQVYLARAPSRGNPLVVIKRIHPSLKDGEHVRAFLTEARVMALLDHPNVVRVLQLVNHGGDHGIAIEFLDGRNLAQLAIAHIRQRKFTPHAAVARVMADALAALHYVHRARGPDGKLLDLLHRDVSPDNIVLGFDGRVKLVDFGIARSAMQEDRTATGIIKGKPGYVSPEAVDGRPVDGRADVFSMGITLYQMLTHERPFGGTSALAQMESIALDPPFPMSAFTDTVPRELERICMVALEKNPARRWLSAGDMRQALLDWLASTGADPDLPGMMERTFPAASDLDRVALASLIRRTARPPPVPLPSEETTLALSSDLVAAALGDDVDEPPTDTLTLNTAMLSAVLDEDIR